MHRVQTHEFDITCNAGKFSARAVPLRVRLENATNAAIYRRLLAIAAPIAAVVQTRFRIFMKIQTSFISYALRFLNSLDDYRDSLAPADAGCGQSISSVSASQFKQQRQH